MLRGRSSMKWRARSSDAGTDVNERLGVLIICYGNPLRCDDGLAWHAAEQLNPLFSPARVQIITCHQLTPELCETLHQVNTVFFIDAGSDGTPGEQIGRASCRERVERAGV